MRARWIAIVGSLAIVVGTIIVAENYYEKFLSPFEYELSLKLNPVNTSSSA
jgi:hypothetical protein